MEIVHGDVCSLGGVWRDRRVEAVKWGEEEET